MPQDPDSKKERITKPETPAAKRAGTVFVDLETAITREIHIYRPPAPDDQSHLPAEPRPEEDDAYEQWFETTPEYWDWLTKIITANVKAPGPTRENYTLKGTISNTTHLQTQPPQPPQTPAPEPNAPEEEPTERYPNTIDTDPQIKAWWWERPPQDD